MPFILNISVQINTQCTGNTQRNQVEGPWSFICVQSMRLSYNLYIIVPDLEA